MRFKKLKWSVGIALVLFILLVGNIIAFGLAQNKQNDSASGIALLAPVYSNKSITSASSGSATNDTGNQMMNTPSQNIVIHRTMRTSAS